MTTCICGQSNFTDHQYIVCNNCQRAIHLECANLLWYQVKEIYIFHCQFCRPYTGPSVLRAVTNHHRNDRCEEGAELLPLQTGTPDFIAYLKKFSALNDARQGADIRKMRGQQLSVKELVISGFDKPILIETKDGLEVITPPGFSLDTLQSHYPDNPSVEAIEVTRQVKVTLKLKALLTHYTIFNSGRTDVFTAKLDLAERPSLGDHFSPPRIVRKLSWVDQYWPNVPFKPLLSKYLFLSMENAFTDFHIDLGGASAWYHVLQGEQVFYLIEPTRENLARFERWLRPGSGSSDSDSTTSPTTTTSSGPKETMLFATTSERTYRSRVQAGETIFIPNGWIYAVLSPVDSITFGGFFLHSLSIAQQLAINDFLGTLNAPAQLAFPAYELTNWYAAPNILKLAKESFKNQPPKHLLEGIEALSEKLRQWLHKAKRGSGSSGGGDDGSSENSIVPQAINCSKLLRDLSICVRSAKSKGGGSGGSGGGKGEKSGNEKTGGTPPERERVGISIKAIKSKILQEGSKELGGLLDLEEARIKDLVKATNSSSGKGGSSGRGDDGTGSGSSALKLTFNMKLAQDVIRRSLDDPYDLNTEANDQEFLLIDSKSGGSGKSSKKKKRKSSSGDQGGGGRGGKGVRREDETYVYLEDDPPDEEENREALRTDKMWQPGSSTTTTGAGDLGFAEEADRKPKKKKAKPKLVVKVPIGSGTASTSGHHHQPSTSGASRPSLTGADVRQQSSDHHHHHQLQHQTSSTSVSASAEQQQAAQAEKAKKFKKGQATPKQRLAKKLFMRR